MDTLIVYKVVNSIFKTDYHFQTQGAHKHKKMGAPMP